MGKQKTIKAAKKRFKVTKNKKILQKSTGQDHFNSREPGRVTRGKRGTNTVAKANTKNIRNFLPN